MYRVVDDFLKDFHVNAGGTLEVFKALQDDKLDFSIVEGHNSLGWLAWHITTAAASIAKHCIGLDVPVPNRDEAVPTRVVEIVQRYEIIANAILREAEKLTDANLLEETRGFTGPTTKGKMCQVLIEHQTHHRGQMTVLLRQAGLTVPPVEGPTKEMAQKLPGRE